MKHFFLYIFIIFSVAVSSQDNAEKRTKAYLQNKDSVIEETIINRNLPCFSAISLDGNKISNNSLTGKITLVNLWFQGCSPCLAEFEMLNRVYHQHKTNNSFQFLSFTFDSPAEIKQTIEKYSLPYKVYPISREECNRLNFGLGFPTIIIINSKGKIVFFRTGGFLDKEKIEESILNVNEKIKKLLNEKVR